MTQGNSPERSQPSSTESAVSFTHFRHVISRWRWEIIALSLVFLVVTAGTLVWQQTRKPPRYRAAASIGIVSPRDSAALSDAVLLSIADSDGILTEMAAELGDEFGPRQRSLTALQEAVSHSVIRDTRNNLQLITLRTHSNTPEKAALLAELWVRKYVEEVSAIATAESDSSRDVLTQELVAAEEMLAEVVAEHVALTLGGDVAGLADDLEARQLILDQRLAARNWELTSSYTEARRIAQRQVDAATLRSQIEGKTDVTLGDLIALQILKSQIFTAGGDQPIVYQIAAADMEGVTKDSLIRELQGIETVLAELAVDLDETITESEAALTAEQEALEMEMRREISSLSADIQAKELEESALKQEIDRLSKRVNNLRDQLDATNADVPQIPVFLASGSNVTEIDVAVGSLLQDILLAFIIGIILSTGFAFVADYAGLQPPLRALFGRTRSNTAS